MQKARRRPQTPTACKHTVSGSFHSPIRGPFHLSLTVLVHYRSLRSIQPWRMVPPRSDRISRVPPYLIPHFDCRLQDFHLLRCDFPDTSTNLMLQAIPISLAATPGISFDFFSYGYLDVSVPHVRYKSSLQLDGLPHSDICGSQLICSSPQLFAAYHVLRSL